MLFQPPSWRRSALAIALGLPLAGTAQADLAPADPADIKALLNHIEGLQRLPVTGLQMVQAGGRTWYVSENGRYVLPGPAFDLWHATKLDSLQQAADLAGRIDLKRLNLDAKDLGALDVGEGQAVLVFVDPQCPRCNHLLGQIGDLDLAKRYRFRLIPLPVLGESSTDIALRLACLAQTAGNALAAATLLDHAEPPPAQPRCGQATIQRAVVSALLLGITGVPYLIAPDGRMHQGEPKDLAAWLAGGAP